MSRSDKVTFVQKALSVLVVVAFVASAVFLIRWVYWPRGVEGIKSKIEKTRAEILQLDKTTGKLQRKVEMLQLALAEAQGTSGTLNSVRTNVTVEVLQPELFRDVLILPGVVEAQDDILLAAKGDGTVEWIGPREGQPVKKGAPIAKIDADVLIPQLRSAEAAESLAQANFRRVDKLADQKVTSPEELDRARSVLKQAQAAVAIARRSVEDATLYSPIDGVVDQIPLDVGEFVNRGQTVARLVDVSTVKINLNVPEKDIAFFHVGQSAQVELPDPPGGETTGTIAHIGLVADDLAKTFLVEVSIANRDELFRPGMIARTELVRRERADAIVVSFFSVMQTQDGPLVYVESQGEARSRAVKIGSRRGMMLEVTEGLEPGDRLIVEGQRMVSDGTPVRVVEVQGSAAPPEEGQP
ncbi:efflux RND transporter periplasmic adaptor subunit [Candidatus Sumerlaeota bacterium]|nr:efflux RND transporter periplasmic adaptor subunit [Candidatus Sumerlaeota bacterium]